MYFFLSLELSFPYIYLFFIFIFSWEIFSQELKIYLNSWNVWIFDKYDDLLLFISKVHRDIGNQ